MRPDRQALVLNLLEKGKYRPLPCGQIIGPAGPVGSTNRKGRVNVNVRHGVHPDTGKQRVVSIEAHQFVWLNAHGHVPSGMQINHIDGNPQNNALPNLELLSASGNMQHAYQTGLNAAARGERSGRSKISDARAHELKTVARARSLLSPGRPRGQNGHSQKALAGEYGLSTAAVCQILSGASRFPWTPFVPAGETRSETLRRLRTLSGSETLNDQALLELAAAFPAEVRISFHWTMTQQSLTPLLTTAPEGPLRQNLLNARMPGLQAEIRGEALSQAEQTWLLDDLSAVLLGLAAQVRVTRDTCALQAQLCGYTDQARVTQARVTQVAAD